MSVFITCWYLAEFCFATTYAMAADQEAPVVTQVEASSAIDVDIPAQGMLSALRKFQRETPVTVSFDTDITQGLHTNGVKGTMLPEEALKRLFADTPLYYTKIRPGSFRIERRDPVLASPKRDGDRARRQASDSRQGAGVFESLNDPTNDPMWVATRKMIGGREPIGMQKQHFDAEAIERTGSSTVEQFLATLPNMHRSGPTKDTFRGLEAETNSARGYAPNLRGLGAGSTLTLYDGRRLAPGGSEGSFTDVSNIPLGALEAIAILPYSASAIYGSEAVGGVIDFVPRRNFKGIETYARAGSVTSGPMEEYQVGQLMGLQFDSGGAMLAFEYLETSALPADARELTRSDLRPFGGDNFDVPNGNPGTLFDLGNPGIPYAIPPGSNGDLEPLDLVPGTQNLNGLRTGSDHLQAQDRISALGSVHYLINDQVKIFADGLFARRQAKTTLTGLRAPVVVMPGSSWYVSPSGTGAPIIVLYDFEDDLGKQTQGAQLDTANFVLGLDWSASEWQFKTSASYATERQDLVARNSVDFEALGVAVADPDRSTAFNALGDGSFTNSATLDAIRLTQRLGTRSELTSFQARVNGPLFVAAGGEAILSLGLEYRDQTFESSTFAISSRATTSREGTFDRQVRSVFTELRVPFFDQDNRRPGIERLEAAVAARYEKYSDFGDKAVPSIGLVWSPAMDVTLRANWSKSYKAPNLLDLNEANNLSQIFGLSDPEAPPGSPQVPMLLWSGKNQELREETATSWTAGLDYKPRWLDGFSAAVSYFDVDFRDRVQEIASAFPNLADPRLAGQINRNPTAAERLAVCERSTFQQGTQEDCKTAPVAALLDLRLQNIAEHRTRGIDAILQFERETDNGSISANLTGTYLLEFSQTLTSSGVVAELLDTQTNPHDLRLRGSVTWEYRGFSATGATNYSDDYSDVASVPNRRVDSWTTYDLQVRYGWNAKRGRLSNTSISLSVENVFDNDPPFLNNLIGIGYDQENADLDGRFVRLYAKKAW